VTYPARVVFSPSIFRDAHWRSAASGGVIADRAPHSLEKLAEITGRAKSNLSRTLRTMEQYGLVRLDRDERGRITPKVIYDRVELDVPLVPQRKAG
jgi:predicted transcriptional regulator